MTLNVALGHAAPTAGARSGDWTRNANAPAEAQGFDEALAGSTPKRKDAGTGGRDDAPASPGPVWRREAYAAAFGLKAAAEPEDATLPDEAGDAAPDALAAFAPEPAPADAQAMPAPLPDTAQPRDDADAPPQLPPSPPADPATAALRALVLPPDDGLTAEAIVTAEPDAELGEPGIAAASAQPATDDPLPIATTVRAASAGAVPPAAVEARPAPAARRASSDTPAAAARQEVRQPPANAAAPLREPVQDTGVKPQPASTRPPDATGAMEMPAGRDARAGTTAGDGLAGRVNVLGFNGAPTPAPAPVLLGATAGGLVAAMEGDASWRQAAAEAALASGQRNPLPATGANTLRIQLNPAELGMVTARLTAVGSQLSIEIQVETSDARQRLANDSEAIVKALRAIGYDVEKVTIQQSSQSGQTGAQANGGGSRDEFQAERQARDEAGRRGRDGGDAAGREGKGSGHGGGEAAGVRSGGGVYI